MNTNQYNHKVAEALRVFRDLNCKTQEEVSERVNIPQCTYSKIESGQRPVNTGELSVITKELNSNILLLIAIVEAKNKNMIWNDSMTLPGMLINFIKLFEGKLDHSEIEKMIRLIKDTFVAEIPNPCDHECPFRSILTIYSKFE